MRDSECQQAFPENSTNKVDIEFLVKDSDSWIDDIFRGREIVNWIKENGFDEFMAHMVDDYLNNAIKFLEKMEKRIIRIQSWYKNNKLTYYAKISKPGNLKRKLLPTKREMPKAHTIIWDEEDGLFRKCANIKEE